MNEQKTEREIESVECKCNVFLRMLKNISLLSVILTCNLALADGVPFHDNNIFKKTVSFSS